MEDAGSWRALTGTEQLQREGCSMPDSLCKAQEGAYTDTALEGPALPHLNSFFLTRQHASCLGSVSSISPDLTELRTASHPLQGSGGECAQGVTGGLSHSTAGTEAAAKSLKGGRACKKERQEPAGGIHPSTLGSKFPLWAARRAGTMLLMVQRTPPRAQHPPH